MLTYFRLFSLVCFLALGVAFSLDNTQAVLIKFHLDSLNLQFFSFHMPLWVSLTIAFILGVLFAVIVLMTYHLKMYFLIRKKGQEANHFKKLAILKHQELKKIEAIE